MEQYLIPYAVLDAKDGVTVRTIYCGGFTPVPNLGTPPPTMTNGELVPESALVYVNNVVKVSLTKLIQLFGPVNALLLYLGPTV